VGDKVIEKVGRFLFQAKYQTQEADWKPVLRRPARHHRAHAFGHLPDIGLRISVFQNWFAAQTMGLF